MAYDTAEFAFNNRTARVHLPGRDCEVVLVFPGGAELLARVRPNSGCVEVVLPGTRAVACYRGDDGVPAPRAIHGLQHERLAQRIVLPLPGS